MRILEGGLDDPRVIGLVNAHAGRARAETGRGSAHALDAASLGGPDTTFWSVWEEDRVLGVGALKRLSLETGAWPYFDAARALYARNGFVECPPFGDYREDPNSVFMTRTLQETGGSRRER